MKVAISAIVLLLLSSATFAASTMPRTPVVIASAPSTHDWSGAYAGAQIGYGLTNNSDYETNLVGTFPLSYSYAAGGALVGLHAGYNLQFSPFVVGIEGDVDAANSSGEEDVPAYTVIYTSRTTTDFDASIRLRAGYAVGRLLMYGTGGLAYGDVKTSYDCKGCVALASGLGTVGGWPPRLDGRCRRRIRRH